jgi:hypothetical protein
MAHVVVFIMTITSKSSTTTHARCTTEGNYHYNEKNIMAVPEDKKLEFDDLMKKLEF